MTIEIIPPPKSYDDYLSNAEPVGISRSEAMSECMIYEPRDGKRRGGNKPMQREFKRKPQRRMIAYDLETDNIAAGTPAIRYITAFAGAQTIVRGRRNINCKPFRYSAAVRGKDRAEKLAHCLALLETEILTEENNRVRFVAWNGNKYDAMLLAQAFLLSPDWLIRPYLTKSKSLRGMRIVGLNEKAGLEFEFLDGMAMTGADTAGMSLKKFVSLFAPDYAKMELDFSKTEFDPDNPEHVAYAERDSEALWYAMQACNEKVIALTGNELQPTIGRAAINYMISQMPDGVKVWRPHDEAFNIIHERAKRGGYVWIAKQYKGKVWKYDLNQAYAGAMRDCELPCGSMVGVHEYQDGLPGLYQCVISRADASPVPFYYKDADNGRAGFTNGKPVCTWILSTEIEHLRRDNWQVIISDGYCWSESFNMAPMVNNLEQMRFSDPQGPSGPLGIVAKYFGCTGYGKTLERNDGISLVLAKECPPDHIKYGIIGDGAPIYAKDEGESQQPYQQPQIGTFITAHVRIQVREGALGMPEHFIYADTDCLAFSAEATHLPIDPRKYGLWKQETSGVDYTFIAKKVYCGADGTKHAKGLRISDLGAADFEHWLNGTVPKQQQLQRLNFLKMASGQPMFRYLKRTGTNVAKLKNVDMVNGQFFPK